jgi:hypothetical protein
MIEHGEQQFDRHQQRDSRPPGQRPAHRLVTAYRDVGREACRRAHQQRGPRQQPGAAPSPVLGKDAQRRDQLQPPATLRPPRTDGLATMPGTKVVHSDPADPNKPVTTTLVWHLHYDFNVIPQTPGIYEVSVNGVRVLSGEVYDYRGNGVNNSCGGQGGGGSAACPDSATARR